MIYNESPLYLCNLLAIEISYHVSITHTLNITSTYFNAIIISRNFTEICIINSYNINIYHKIFRIIANQRLWVTFISYRDINVL